MACSHGPEGLFRRRLNLVAETLIGSETHVAILRERTDGAEPVGPVIARDIRLRARAELAVSPTIGWGP